MKSSKMNRRLRKKLYLGEFAVKGFEFSISLSKLSKEQVEAFFDSLLLFIESRSLLVGGGGEQDKFSCYVLPNARYNSATEEDRTVVEQWLKSQEGTSDAVVEPLTDAYHGS